MHIPTAQTADPPAERAQLLLCLFGGLAVVRDGRRTAVPEGAQRLLALMTLRGGQVERRTVASALWPDCSDERAAGNLRTALWRLKGAGLDLLDVDHATLRIADRVHVDVHDLTAWTDRLVRAGHDDADLVLEGRPLDCDDLLPGWDDEWVAFARERVRQRILHGLEALSQRLRERGRHAEAVEAALYAVQLEPLRESAQRALILAHLGEGNLVEARRTLAAYRSRLREDLGVDAGPELLTLVQVPPPRRHE